MTFFDFSEAVEKAVASAGDLRARLSARTTVHRALFPGAVKAAGFRLLQGNENFGVGHQLVVGAAPWSDSDLAALEDLVLLSSHRDVTVTVFDIDSLSYPEMQSLLPGLQRFARTPVLLYYKNGELVYQEQGHDAVLWLREF